jgi:DNA-binding Lrp family transcriptional regulator
MTMEKFKPAPVMTIKDLETLKVVSDPFRVQILEILVSGPQSVNQVAEKMGLPPSKLYYHVNMLEKHGLIQVVDTTVHGNIIEKHYWISAYDLKMDNSLCSFGTPEGQENVVTMMVVPIDATRQDIIRSLEARAFALERGAEKHPRDVLIYRELSNISDEQADEFLSRLKELTQMFEGATDQESGDDVQTHALTIAFYPSFYYHQPRDEGEEDLED